MITGEPRETRARSRASSRTAEQAYFGWGIFMAAEEAGLALASLNMRSSYRGGRAVQESTDAALDIKITS